MDSFELNRELQTELAPGERLLWSGRPRRRIIAWPVYILLVAFATWLGLRIVQGNTTASGEPLLTPSLVIPLAFSVIVMAGSLVLGLRMPSLAIYGVTSERVLIVARLFKRYVTSIPFNALENVTLASKGGGGDITLFQKATLADDFTAVLALSGDAQNVYDLIIGSMPSKQGETVNDTHSSESRQEEEDSFENW